MHIRKILSAFGLAISLVACGGGGGGGNSTAGNVGVPTPNAPTPNVPPPPMQKRNVLFAGVANSVRTISAFPTLNPAPGTTFVGEELTIAEGDFAVTNGAYDAGRDTLYIGDSDPIIYAFNNASTAKGTITQSRRIDFSRSIAGQQVELNQLFLDKVQDRMYVRGNSLTTDNSSGPLTFTSFNFIAIIDNVSSQNGIITPTRLLQFPQRFSFRNLQIDTRRNRLYLEGSFESNRLSGYFFISGLDTLNEMIPQSKIEFIDNVGGLFDETRDRFYTQRPDRSTIDSLSLFIIDISNSPPSPITSATLPALTLSSTPLNPTIDTKNDRLYFTNQLTDNITVVNNASTLRNGDAKNIQAISATNGMIPNRTARPTWLAF